MELTLKQKAAFGIGAVGKDMVYALSASYVMYYYQDVLGLGATFVGLILMIARVFDALNDPFMGVLVAKTHSRWGRFRPWLFSGTVLNALALYALFAAPQLEQAGLMVYFSVVYILWGVTYTMMDIPYWSMIPAVTRTPADREHLSVVGRTCAGVGSALIAMFTVLLVGVLGGGNERTGFARFALIVSGIFIAAEVLCCVFFRENSRAEMKTAGVREMFSALLRNDQAMVVVASIVLINSSLYLTSNFVIYFFKYDFGGAAWQADYTLFSTVGGAAQILGMMALYPLLRKRLSSTQVFVLSMGTALFAYALLPCGVFFRSAAAAGSRRTDFCLQRDAFRTHHAVFVEQCGLRPAENRPAGRKCDLLHANVRSQGGLRRGGVFHRHRAGSDRPAGQYG